MKAEVKMSREARKKLLAHIWARRVQGVLGCEPQDVQEALEGLRRLYAENRTELEQIARSGWFIQFDQRDLIQVRVRAALTEALGKLRTKLGVEEAPSTLRVWEDPKRKEGKKPQLKTWRSPEGLTYEVSPADYLPGLFVGLRIKHPQYGVGSVTRLPEGDQALEVRFRTGLQQLDARSARQMALRKELPDTRVEQARQWVAEFLNSAEVVTSPSRIERELKNRNPEGFIPEGVAEALWAVGLKSDPTDLEALTSLATALPAREERLMELARQAAQAEGEGKTRDALESFAALGSGFDLSEANRLLKSVALPKATARALATSLKEVAAVRQLRLALERAGFSPTRALAYRDPSGEVVYVAPVYG
jgi:hypothetical protein